MIRRPPRSTRTDTLFPYTTLFRSPEAYQGWLAAHADVETVDVVMGDPGAEADIHIMLPEDERIPWSGHSGRWAARQVMKEIEAHRKIGRASCRERVCQYV